MKNHKLLIGIIVGTIIAAGLSVGFGLYKNSLAGKFPPGTLVANVDISLLTFDEAKKALWGKSAEYLKTPMSIEVLGKTRQIKPKDLGVSLSIEASLRTLEPISLNKSTLWNLLGLGPKQNETLPAVVGINYDQLSATLENNFKLNDIAPKSANASFGKNGEFLVTDGRDGTEIDMDAFLKELKISAQNLQKTTIKVTTFNRKPQVGKEELLAYQDKIKTQLNLLITLDDPIYRDNWQIRLKKYPDWISFVPKREIKMPFTKVEKKAFVMEINQQKLDKYVDENISKWLDRPAKEVNIYTGENGKVVIEGRGNDGKKIQREQLKKAIELAIENNIENVPIPTVSLTPKINISQDLRDKGITERLAVGHTSYYGSPENRVFNIKHGAKRFEGALIAPDATFSFNKALGNVDGATGFKKELVIKPEGTVPDYGGGICQVSTTMYRAALFAGLPIIERNQHTYAVTYYSQILGHGLDATIFLGGPDLKFKNDTGHHLLLQAYTEGGYELYVVLYGTPDGRRVEMEGPYISRHVGPPPDEYVETTNLPVGATKNMEHAHPGFDALWYRHLFDKDNKETKEPIETSYRAMPEKIAIGVAPKPEPSPVPAPPPPKK